MNTASDLDGLTQYLLLLVIWIVVLLGIVEYRDERYKGRHRK